MYRDARKTPWYTDLTPAEMEAIIAAVPVLLEVAKIASLARPHGYFSFESDTLEALLERLNAAHPNWRTWLTEEQRSMTRA